MVSTTNYKSYNQFVFIILVVYAVETERRSEQGRVISSSELEFEDFDTRRIYDQGTTIYEDKDFYSQELAQVQRETKVIIEELEKLVVTVEGESIFNDCVVS